MTFQARPDGRAFQSRARALALVWILSLFLPAIGSGGSFQDAFIDPADGQFDTGKWLKKKRGFLPIPIIITEPALGYGGGVALLFIHGEQEDREGQEEHRSSPPSNISAVFGFGTETSTWGAGAYHFGSFRKDGIRYKGTGGYTSAFLTFYPVNLPVQMNLAGFLIDQQLEFRIGETDLFLGGRFTYVNLDVTRESGGSGVLPDALDSQIGGIGFFAHWDSRDNIFNPNSGLDSVLGAMFNSPAFGGSDTWWEIEYRIHSYHTLHPRLVLGVRFDGDLSFGDTPFYARPYVDLRGIPALRYQGEMAGEGEIDLRWRVYKRWSLVGFVGVGWTSGSTSGDNGPFPAGGGGFRYLIARELGMQAGIDVATSQEDTAFYIQVGSAW